MRRRGLLGLLLAPLAMRGTGGTPGQPAGYVPPSLPGQAAGSSSQIVRAREVVVSGPGGGLYVYQPGTVPARGNPPIFWAGASPDPYGNVLPATAGVAGTGTFAAGNTLITSAGIFTYSGTPAAGNLIESSGVSAAGTDSFGNHYLAGDSTYASAFATSLQSGFVAFYSGSLSGGWGAALSEVAGDAAGNLQANAGGQLQLVGVGSVAITGATTINGSNATGTGLPAGTPTSGPNGSVFAGHTHDFDGHTHAL